MHYSGRRLIDPDYVLDEVGLQPAWQVADLGCGALGHFVFPAARRVGGEGRVYAVDILRSALTAIERTAKHEQLWNVIPVWSDIEVPQATAIPQQAMDLTILANNLYLSRRRQEMLAEALRLTKPGGLLLVIEWKKMPTVLGPALADRLDEDEVKRHVARHGADHVHLFDGGDHHYALVFQKPERAPTDAQVIWASQAVNNH